MKKLILILVFFSNFILKAQVTYQKFYNSSLDAVGLNNIITFNDNSFIIGPGSFIKFDYLGNVIWAEKVLGNVYFPTAKIIKIDEQTILAGYMDTVSSNSCMLIKLDTSGLVLWSKKYTIADGQFLFLANETNNKGFVFTGASYRTGPNGIFILNIDSLGNIGWCRTFRIDSVPVTGTDVIQTDDHGFLVGAFYQRTAPINYPYNPYFILKLDSTGRFVRALSTHYGESYYGKFFKIGINKYVVPGDGSIMCFDSTGSLLWLRWTNFYFAFHGALKPNGHVFVPGGIGTENGFIELDTSGNVIQATIYWPDSLGLATHGISTFNDASFISNGGLYVIKSDTNNLSGCYEQPVQIWDSVINDVSTPLTIITDTETSVTAIPFFPTIVPITLTDSVVCMHSVGISEINSSNKQLNVYPNPQTSSSTLQFTTQLKDAEVVIYDMVGKEMMRKKLAGNRMEIDRGSLESGVYFVRVRSEERQWVQKLVVE